MHIVDVTPEMKQSVMEDFADMAMNDLIGKGPSSTKTKEDGRDSGTHVKEKKSVYRARDGKQLTKQSLLDEVDGQTRLFDAEGEVIVPAESSAHEDVGEPAGEPAGAAADLTGLRDELIAVMRGFSKIVEITDDDGQKTPDR